MKALFTILLMSLSFSALAKGGDRVGNGGDVVVCGSQVELLDVYESRVLAGHELATPEGNNYQEMLRNLLKEKLKVIQPKKLVKYLSYLENFNEEAQFLSGIQLNDIDDSGLVILPQGCKLEQIIVQLPEGEVVPGRKRYTVNLDLWKKLDEFNKMALTLHEIAYREGIESDNANSMMVRGMVGQLISKKIDLGDYLTFSSRISRDVEYKKMDIGKSNENDLVFKSYLDVDQDEILSLTGYDFSFVFRHEYKSLKFLEIRVRDDQVVTMIGRYNPQEYLFKLLKAHKSYPWGNNKTLRVSVDKEILYYKNKFEAENFNMVISYEGARNLVFSIANASKVEMYFDVYKKLIIRGNFALKSDILNLDYGNNQGFVFDTSGAELTKILLESGSYNCSVRKDKKVFENCEQGSEIWLPINTGQAYVTLNESSKKLDLMNNEDLFVKVNSDVTVGYMKSLLGKKYPFDLRERAQLHLKIKNGIIYSIKDEYGRVINFKNNGEVIVTTSK